MSGDWTDFGIRDRPSRSTRVRVKDPPPFISDEVQRGLRMASESLRGVALGNGIRDVLSWPVIEGRGRRITEAGLVLLDALDTEQRARMHHDMDAPEWRLWFNIHPNVLRHGVMLEDLSVGQRAAALNLLRASLSDRGFQQARSIMRINGFLRELTGMRDDFGEWPYFLSLFGHPTHDEPWGWQLDGHHLNLNVIIFGDRLAMTPSFMGSEPCRIATGPLAGTEVMGNEERAGLAFMRSLDDAQLGVAIGRPSIQNADLPPELTGPIDGRMVAGAFRDNADIPNEGLQADALSDAQRRLLRSVIASFVGWASDDHAAHKMAEVDAHLDETYFAWMGPVDDVSAFYFRVQSPVVLAEFDHHSGVVFDNAEPSRNHTHSVVRVPNGGDYGVDLLRQHHEQFAHEHGRHVHRP